ncbi:MAG TPA: monofunctional biosynthetic peptidoglycan transglycosylase [Chitinispirillaceae bacterium]|nr:monofunctional biosynthetic peptidoglycan transglycosylase [Chitinispirillaceae bacterium]
MNKKRNFAFWKIIAALVITIIASDLIWYFFIVDVNQLKTKNPGKTAFMKYREKQWKKKKRSIRIQQEWVTLGAISTDARRAVVVAEDAKFWKHEGFDFEAMHNAIEKDFKKRKLAVGASTISMQVAKNMFLSPSKTPVRKINEAILTWRMEKMLTKKRILELYLNIAEWGDGIFGIEAASRTYFYHSAALLNKNEAALLAAVLPNPIRFNPLKNSRFVKRRSHLILRAIGGDVHAAVALHSIDNSMKPQTADTATVPLNDSLNADVQDTSHTVISETDSVIKTVPIQDSLSVNIQDSSHAATDKEEN